MPSYAVGILVFAWHERGRPEERTQSPMPPIYGSLAGRMLMVWRQLSLLVRSVPVAAADVGAAKGGSASASLVEQLLRETFSGGIEFLDRDAVSGGRAAA
jgi:hypothetical protein